MKRISADGILPVAFFCENVLIDKNQKRNLQLVQLVRLRTLRGKWICVPDRVLHALLRSALALCQKQNGYISSFSSPISGDHESSRCSSTVSTQAIPEKL